VDMEPLEPDAAAKGAGWTMPARSKAGASRRSLRLEIRFRSTARGAAGVWRIE
jgi:hypothetical protein